MAALTFDDLTRGVNGATRLYVHAGNTPKTGPAGPAGPSQFTPEQQAATMEEILRIFRGGDGEPGIASAGSSRVNSATVAPARTTQAMPVTMEDVDSMFQSGVGAPNIDDGRFKSAPIAIPGGPESSGVDAARPADILAVQGDPAPAAPVRQNGPELPGHAQMSINFLNTLPAAEQRTTPDISRHRPNFLSDEIHETDWGAREFRDPTTGKSVPLDGRKHVVLTDPADGKLKVFGRKDETNEGVMPGLARVLLNGFAAGAPATAGYKAAAPTIAELKTAATNGLKSAALADLKLSPRAILDFAGKMELQLTRAGYPEAEARAVFEILRTVPRTPGKALFTGSDLQSLYKALETAARSPDQVKKEAAQEAIKLLDGFLPGVAPQYVRAGDLQAATETLAAARRNSTSARQAEAIDPQKVKTQLLAAGSDSKVPEQIRQRLAQILDDPRQLGAYTPEQIAQIRLIVEDSLPQQALRAIGGLAGGKGGVDAVLAAIAGGLGLGATGVGLPAAGLAMRGLANRMTLKQSARLSEAIRSGAPLASSLGRFEEAASAFHASQNLPALGALTLAARELARNLNREGVQVSTSDLVHGVRTQPRVRSNGAE